MEIEMIPKNKISPSSWQPREHFSEEDIKELASSIQGMGIIEPIVVRKKGDGYKITAGERRWRAYKMTDYDKIPCVVKDEDDTDAKVTSVIENWHREEVKHTANEKFLSDLYEEGKNNGKWDSIHEMSKVTGIPRSTLGDIIYAYGERKKLAVDGNVSYQDIVKTRSLKDMPEERKKILEMRAEKKIPAEKLRDVATDIIKMPKPVRKAVLDKEIEYERVKPRLEVGIPDELANPLVEELKKEKEEEESLRKYHEETDKAVLTGDLKHKEITIKRPIEEQQVEKIKKLYRQVSSLSVVHFEGIKYPKYKEGAIYYLKRMEEHCSNILLALGEKLVRD